MATARNIIDRLTLLVAKHITNRFFLLLRVPAGVRAAAGRWRRIVALGIALLALSTLSGIAFVQAQGGPAVELTKDFGGSTALEAESGQEFTYYIAYRCASITENCNAASMTDPLPPEVTFVDTAGPSNHVDDISYDSVNHEVVATFVDPLPAGSTGVIEISVMFPPGTLPGTTAVNSAESISNGVVATSNSVTATAIGAFEMFPDKSVAGDFDDGVIGSAFTTNYALQVCNPDDAGGVPLNNPEMVDQLPATATFVGATHDGVYDAGSHTITWTYASNGGGLPDTIPVTGGCSLTVGVTVRFDPDGPDGIPGSGDEPQIDDVVSNTMTLTGDPADGSPAIDMDDAVDLTLRGPYFGDAGDKASSSPSSYTGRGTEELPGGPVHYTVSYENTGTITATNVILTDVLDSRLIVERIEIGPAVDPANGFYETAGNPGVWLPFPGNGYGTNATVPVTTTATADPSDIELAPGDQIAGIRWELGTFPAGAPQWSAGFDVTLDPSVPAGTTIPNCMTVTAEYVDGSSMQSSNGGCSNVTATETRAIPRVSKSASRDALLPGEVTEFTLTAYNADVAHNDVVAPITLADLLPTRLEVVVADDGEPSGFRPPTPAEITSGDWYTFSATDGAPAPSHTYTPNFGGGPETLLRWEWDAPYQQAPGEEVTITFFARALDYTLPQVLDNVAIGLWDDVDTDNALSCDGTDGVDPYTDAQDVDGDGDTTETGCQVGIPVTIEAFLSMDSKKYVSGELDSEWSDYSFTVTGGDADYRMVITNTSNVTATNLVVYDIFPHVGDTGVIDPSMRASEWRPHLIAPITDLQGYPLTVYYSQSTNPCRPEVLPSGPAGCTDDWSTTPPPDITSVQAVRLAFCDAGGCLELPPDTGSGGGHLDFSWHMVAPNSAQVGDVAWNSFGFTAAGGGLTLLPSEPIRVGLEVAPNPNPGVSVGDYVWLDVYGRQDDGVQQPEEMGISGVRVELREAAGGALIDFRATGPDAAGNPGYYEFNNVLPGDYFLRFFPLPEHTTSPANQGGDDALDSDGETAGTDGTYGDYVETTAFTVGATDDLTWDQGLWVNVDYGDAPGAYPTEAAAQANPADAARHIIVEGVHLGAGVDDETDGQPDDDALGDDGDGNDDEDGVDFTYFIGTAAQPSAVMFIGEGNEITVSPFISSPLTTTTSAYLNAWIDFNADGDWDDVGEQVIDDVAVDHGVTENVTISVPGVAVPTATYARFRLSTEAGLGPRGTAVNGEVEDYEVQLINHGRKEIAATSEGHTSETTSSANVAIGEIVRYRLIAPVPEGTVSDFQVVDNLPGRLQFLDDGTHTLSTTADTSVTHSTFTLSGGPFGSGTNPVFELGTVTNNDDDADEEFVIVEFNALTLNHAASDAGDNRNNNYDVSYDTFTDRSNTVRITIVEPNTTVAKSVTTAPADAGDTVVYELVAGNGSGANSATAFDLLITDTLDSSLTMQALSITAPGYAAVSDNSSVPGNLVDVGIDRLEPGDDVTIVVTATVVTTATAGETIPNVADLTYSSLPGEGTLVNPTGSNTPGSSGSSTGERNGDGGLNDHFDADSGNVTLATPTVVKQVSPADYTIGESVTFDLLVTLPEGVTEDLVVLDDVPSGLSYVSHQIVETAAASGGLLAADYNGTLPAPSVTAPGGNGVNVAFDFGDTTTTADNDAGNNTFLIRVTALVLNVFSNQNGDTLTNVATLNYTRNGNPATASDTADVDIVEPVLAIEKELQTPLPSPLDAGTIITYTMVLEHAGSSAADAYDVVMTDTVPADLINVVVESVTASGVAAPAFDLTGNVLRVPDGGSFDMPQGAVVTVTLSAEIGATAVPGTEIANTAGATWSTLDGAPPEERDGGGEPDGSDLLDGGALDDYEVASTATFEADGPTFTKALVETSADHTAGSEVTIGEIITYSLAITLPEGTIPSLQVIDALPAGLAYVPGSAVVDDASFNGTVPAPAVTAAGGSGNPVIFDFASFTVPADNDPTNNSFTIRRLQAVVLDEAGNVGVDPPGFTTLTNNATVQVGSEPAEPAPPVAVTVVEPQLTIGKSFNTNEASPNDVVTVTLTVDNVGASTAFDVIVDDPVANDEFTNITEGTTAAGFTFSTVAAGGDTIVRYTGGSIPAGGSVQFTFEVTLAPDLAPSPPDLTNVATVTQATTLDSTADDGDDGEERDEPDVSDDDDLTVIVPDIALSKENGQSLVSPGELVTYTLTVENVGGAGATGVVITETVPANTTFAGPSGWACTPDGSAGSTCTYTVGALSAGGSVDVDFAVDIDAPLPDGTSFISNAAVAADDGTHGIDPDPDNNDDDDTDDVTASIGDFVWEDTNGNGVQDDGATGVGGVTVDLYDGGGTPISSTTTLADGSYRFINLPPGDYYVTFTLPGGYAFSPQNQGDDAADSDANSSTGQTAVTTLDPGENDTTWDAGIYEPASIGDYVWYDLDQDGVQDGAEAGLYNVTVTLYDSGDNVAGMTTTDAGGLYSFTGLQPGAYYVEIDLPAGYSVTLQDQGGDDMADSDVDPVSNQTPVTALVSGEDDPTWDAGLYAPPAAIGNLVWLDADQDGLQDGDELGIGGVTVNLYDYDDNFIGTTTTDANGLYGFADLPPDDYYVEVVPPAGYTITLQDQGGDDAVDSDVDTTSGQAAVTTLAADESDPTWDAGLYIHPAAIGDYIWLDADQDGIQDSGEYGVGGVTVELYDGGGNLIATTTSDAYGGYAFANLPPGDYYVAMATPAGYTIVAQDQGGDDTVDSDVDPATGETTVTALSSGENDPTWDGGLYIEPAATGDRVWLDANENGVQDAGEFGIGGVTVNLYDDDDNLIETTTTTAGAYTFANLPPGAYYVQVVPPGGYTISPQDQGADDTVDSDVDASSGQTAVTTLDPAENDPTWDAGLYIDPAGIGDFVWLDADQDGIQDGDEFGTEGVTVNLYDAGDVFVDTTTTDAYGQYSFVNLVPGDYHIEVIVPAGYTISLQDQGGDDAVDSDVDPATGQSVNTTLSSDEVDPDWDGGLYVDPASIGDFVWLDADQDGVQDGEEYGVGNVPVALYDDAGNLLATTTTDGNGLYSFENVPPADYYVHVTPPAGYTIAAQNQGGDDTADSDIDPATGETTVTALTSGENDPTWDGGLFVEPAALGDFVWLDADQDGLQDGDEFGVEGVTVNLYDGDDTLIGSTTSDVNGRYGFVNLPPNDYTIEVVPPGGFSITAQDQGGDDTADSDVDTTSGRSAETTLTAGENDPTWDAGLYVDPASLGDFIWLDADQDGVQDGDEYGVGGVTVELYEDGGTLLDATTTDANGGYSFVNLPPGDYYVAVTAPAGYTIVAQDQGGDDTLDSDLDPATGETVVTNLSSGENDPTWDGGLYIEPASIGDYVWLDADLNGTQDFNESGVPGVTVNLYDGDDNLIGTTSTDADGLYRFDNLPPNDYYVAIVTLGGFDLTTPDQGGDDTVDSDADPGTGQMATTTLVAGEEDLTWDAGLVPAVADLGNYVWYDLDRDGVQDAGEPGVANVTVNLYDGSGNFVNSTTTDANGLYLFDDLTPGDYGVDFVPPVGFTFTEQDQGGDDAVDSDADMTSGRTILTALTPGENDTTWDAGLVPDDGEPTAAAIGDYVWEDLDRDGVQDAGEPGVANVTVTLYRSDDTLVGSTATDANGLYTFANLTPDDYYVAFSLPAGYAFTQPGQGGDDTADSDADTTTGQTATTTLAAGEDDPTWDAGLVRPQEPTLASIGDTVWHDLDGDGVREVGEPGVANVTVNLYDGADTLVAFTTTDGDGLYRFDSVAPGDYYVAFTRPAGYAFTQQDQGGDDAADSDADTTTGQTALTTLDPSEHDPTWDAGLVQPQDPALASLGDTVWHDLDGDGVQEAGEPGVPNVQVNLFSGPVLTATTTTDLDGLYTFADLTPGDYSVVFVPPVGYGLTQQDQGVDDTVDSDADPATGQTIVTALTAGENDPTWDAGLVAESVDPALASLGDTVWHDLDGDGVLETGEPGVANVTVNVYDSSDTLTGTTTTDADGLYRFANLTPGDYYVAFVLPGGYTFTQQDQGGDDTADSDADPATGQTAVTTLEAGENDPTWDAGLVQAQDPQSAAIGNYVWQDVDQDGIQDAGEPGIAGVSVNLYDSGDALVGSTATDGNGLYTFTNLTPGDYYVAFAPPAGYAVTAQDQGGDDTADSDADADPFSPAYGQAAVTTLSAGENDTTWDAGMYVPTPPATASLGDLVWEDLNADGIQDAGEPGLFNVTVNLFDSSGTFTATTVTDGSGYYAFTELTPGDYYVAFVPPQGYHFSPQDGAADDLVDSDADPDRGSATYGQTAVTTLTAGENDPTWDAGLYQQLRLGNRVWHDLDDDGVVDGAEAGLGNVVLELLDAGGAPVVDPLTGQPVTTTTDAAGYYDFSELPAGTYHVRIAAGNFDGWSDPLYGFVSSAPTFSADDAVDDNDSGQNNADPANGGVESGPVTLAPGTEPTTDTADEDGNYDDDDSNLTVDFGFFELLTLGNRVWFDVDEDGVNDPGESGASGVLLRLLDGDGEPVLHPVTGQPIAATTNGDGFYQFTNLMPGDYAVEVAPENFQAGGVLDGFWSSEGFVDPDNDDDGDDNGVDKDNPWTTGIASNPVTVDYSTEPDNFDDTDDNDNTNLTVDFGFVTAPTAVELTSFSATSAGAYDVVLRWETASEIDNFGFRLYRSATPDFATATEIHFEPSALPGGSGPGAVYEHADTTPGRGLWYYWLEDVETGGATHVYEPVSVDVTGFYTTFMPVVNRD